MATTIDITPDVSLLKKAGEVNYKIPDALADLTDNSIDARLPGQKLVVEITLSQRGGQKHIVVADNGTGMSADTAGKAMVMAYSSKERGAIGEFGFGLKTACSNLGGRFEIVTTTEDAKVATRIVYDEDVFIRNGTWKLELEEAPKPFPRGTRITISALKVNLYAGAKDTVLDKFGKIFKHFISSGEAVIEVNGDPVVPYVPDTLADYDTEIRYEVNGKLVRGWASLLRTASPKGGYGFDLIRHNRVVIEHEKLGFAAQAGLARLVGELHLDDFGVVNNKTDFRRDTEDWTSMVRTLNEDFLVDLKRQARKLANPRKFASKDQADVEEYIEDIKKALKSDDLQQDIDRRALDAELAAEFSEGALPFNIPSESGEPDAGDLQAEGNENPENGSDGRARPEPGEISSVTQHRLNRVKTQLRNIVIEHQLARLGRDSLYKIWDVEGVAAHKRLVVTTNQDHPLYSAIESGFMLWVKHNIVEAVAEYLTQAMGQTDAMLLVKSDILKHIGKMQLEILEEPTYPPEEAAEG